MIPEPKVMKGYHVWPLKLLLNTIHKVISESGCRRGSEVGKSEYHSIEQLSNNRRRNWVLCKESGNLMETSFRCRSCNLWLHILVDMTKICWYTAQRSINCIEYSSRTRNSDDLMLSFLVLPRTNASRLELQHITLKCVKNTTTHQACWPITVLCTRKAYHHDYDDEHSLRI